MSKITMIDMYECIKEIAKCDVVVHERHAMKPGGIVYLGFDLTSEEMLNESSIIRAINKRIHGEGKRNEKI